MRHLADYLFADPARGRGDVLTKFGKEWQCSVRSIDRVIAQAREYNSRRTQAIERVSDRELVAATSSAVRLAVLTRQEAEGVLTQIATEAAAAPGDKIRAIAQLAKMRGWEQAPKEDARVVINVDGGLLAATESDVWA